MRNTILLFGLLVILFACSKKDEKNEHNLFTVSGIVYQKGEPAENVQVSIDDAFNYTVLTNENGEFLINDVTKGGHKLNIYKTSSALQNLKSTLDDNDSYIMKSIDLDVNNNITLDNLKLPKPIIIDTILNINLGKVQLIWESTDAEDFREYKVFKHTSSGLDETTGELIHVSTSKTDTSVTINTLELSSGTYFYRVSLALRYN